MPIQRATVCSISNQLATTGCQAVGTAYDIDLPADKVPTVACEGAWRPANAVCSTVAGSSQKRRPSRTASLDHSGDFSAEGDEVISRT